MKGTTLIAFILLGFLFEVRGKRYTPDWPSLDSRPLPSWYDKAKFGIFMHFGPYAVPGVGSEWFWNHWSTGSETEKEFMINNFSPRFSYQDFGPLLKMEFFNPDEFANIVEASGAKYFVFTSKHHDGYVNFNSSYTFGWKSLDVGPKRDVVGELRDAFDKHPNIHFGLYHSLFEWYNPLYLADKASSFKRRSYVKGKMWPEIKELVLKYKPEIIWSDGDWEAPPEYWGSQDILAWLFNDGPTKDTIVVNDRWGKGTPKKHGSFYSGPDHYNPGVIQKHKFEDATTVDSQSWGYRRNINLTDIFSSKKLIQDMVSVVSCGGNFLLNVGPTKEGTIAPIFQERLKTIGLWLKVNGESIYESVSWQFQNETSLEEKIPIWYTARPDLGSVYAILFDWPSNEPSIITSKYQLILQKGDATLLCLGNKGKKLPTKPMANGLQVTLPPFSKVRADCLNQQGGDVAYVLKFSMPNNTFLRPEPFVEIIT